MFFHASVHAYDVMDQVQIVASVAAIPDEGSAHKESVLRLSTTIAGTGETDSREWLQDALVGLLETL